MDLLGVQTYRTARDRADLALGPGETLVAGGTWLFSEPQPGTTGLVDLTALGWTPWTQTDAGLEIAATCTVEQLLAVPDGVWGPAADVVRRCAEAFLMSFKIQTQATVGGNVCLALPAGAMTALLVALEATALVWTIDGGERREPVADLVHGVRRTSLAPDEVLRAFLVPASALAGGWALRQASLAPLGRSSALLLGRSGADGTTVSITAATSRPVVLRFPARPGRAELAQAVESIDCWYADAHGPLDWRRAVTASLAEDLRQELDS